MKKHIFAAIAAISMMGAFSGIANAAWTADATDNKVPFQLTAKTAQAMTGATVTFTEGLVPTGGRYTITLTNGATFVGTPTAVPTNGVATILGSAVGAASATFSVTTGAILGAITITPGSINLSAVPAGGSVDITYSSADNLGNPIIPTTSLDAAGANAAASLPPFTMVNAFGATVVAATDLALVSGAFKVFGNGVVGTPQSGATTGLTISSTATTAPTIGNDTVLVTLSGNFAGIGSVSGTNITGSNAAGSTTGGTNGFFSIDRTVNPNKAYAVAKTAFGDIIPIFVWDAVTPQQARGFTVQVDGSAGTIPAMTYPFQVLAPTTIYTTTRNGANFTSDNISTTSVIRIADNGATSTTPAAIIVTAWDAAGAQVTQVGATLPTSMLGGSTVTIKKGVLKAAFPTAVRFNINVEASNVSVTHFKANAAGLNVTVGSVGNGSVPQL